MLYPEYSRWVSLDKRVWEKRDWGWKFLGFAKSVSFLDIMELNYTDCDHPYDVFIETINMDSSD